MFLEDLVGFCKRSFKTKIGVLFLKVDEDLEWDTC